MTGVNTLGKSVRTMLRAIPDAPGGPHTAAFFDFDGTLLEGIGPLRSGTSRTAGGNHTAALLRGLSGRKNDAHRASVRRMISETWRGRPVADLVSAEERLCHDHLSRNLYPEAWELVHAHRRAGHTVVLATSATPFQARILSRELGIEHLLCTEPAVADGRFTGAIAGEIVWGSDKADLVEKFAAAHDIDLANSFAYSNGGADIPLLRSTGHPVAVNPDRGLAAAATAGGWPVLRFESRRNSPRHIARTLLGALAVIGAAGAAFLCSPNSDPRTKRQRLLRWAPTAAFRCAGIRVHVTDTANALATRPAVFVFNHQSKLDALIVPYLVGDSFTPVVTRKAQRYPIFGRILGAAGSLFIDRSTPGGAQQALNSLATELHAGNSVAISPEGRISPTPRLQSFKKGAFHLATQAQVPIVPIVIRNAGRAMWRNALTVRPETIEVVILEPIDTADWTPETLNEEIAAVRRRYLEALGTNPC
ncbi:HAD-IB family hydrolase [Nocardia speluncae]|uniref:HAD-IB family hydrolase n=1 Tax=Nocardia speluncae TaxID=419477 RepID=A0A846XHH2_9NOCA|nr:HAD-IB family hydrolase [Nocardia speluncae]NKY34116.1 HAD-IB family hydrolase [Nocardia speluncae]